MTTTNGILLLNKPSGITSFRALGKVKSSLKDLAGSKIKVGHTGTLDRFAEGLLVVLTGKYTRLNQAFTDMDKSYLAEIKFGTTTETLDPEGEITEVCEIPSFEIIRKKIPLFTGSIKQRPPIYSAVHVDGKRAYKHALSGEQVIIPEREVTIFSFEIIKWESPVLLCRIHCSKGTYIRSIADDLGKACGSCAYLQSLKRLSVGPFTVEDAVDAENVDPPADIISGKAVFNLLDSYYPENFKIIEVDKSKLQHIRNGKILEDKMFVEPPQTNGRYAVFSSEEFIAYVEKAGDQYNYVFVTESRDNDENN